MRVFLGLQLDLNIVEIGKHQLAAAHLLEAARLPDLEVALLRMRVEHAVAFLAAEIDGRIEDAPGEAATAAFVPHCQPLELCEAGKIADPHASNRLAVLVADQMGGGKIVAVEFLLERTSLLGHVDRAADRDHARHLIHRPHHLDGDGIAGRRLNRHIAGAIEHLQVRREQSVIMRARRKPEGLQHPQTALGHRTRIDVDAPIERRGEFLQHQRDCGCDGALGVNGPDIDAGGPFRLTSDIAKLWHLGIEPAIDQPPGAFMRQRQHGKEAVSLEAGDIEPVALGDRPERIGVMIGDRLEHLVRREAGNILARRIDKRCDTCGIDVEDHRAFSELQRGHPVERERRGPIWRGSPAGGFAY